MCRPTACPSVAPLRDQHDLAADGSADDFSVINQQDILDSVTQTTQTLTLFLGAIAAISLLVGGIGIMNIISGMLESM